MDLEAAGPPHSFPMVRLVKNTREIASAEAKLLRVGELDLQVSSKPSTYSHVALFNAHVNETAPSFVSLEPHQSIHNHILKTSSLVLFHT